MQKKIRFGLMGCARICRRGLIPGIRGSQSAEVAAIASMRPGTAQAWGTEFQIPHTFDSYEKLLASPEIDAVYIPLSNELHREWTFKAAEAGKHVLCEKPLALDATQAGDMARKCAQHNVLLMEAFMWRHHPRVEAARRLIADGKLGELRLVKMDFSFDIDRTDWRLDPARGGGPIFDLCCYGINAARLFFGQEPTEVFARSKMYKTGVDMTTAVELVFPGGGMGLIDGSFECPYRNRIEIVGTKGIIELPQGVLPPPRCELVYRADDRTEIMAFPTADQYAEQVKAFCRGIAEGSLPAPAENGEKNMQVLETALRQIQAQGRGKQG